MNEHDTQDTPGTPTFADLPREVRRQLIAEHFPKPSDTELVAAVQQLPDDDQRREQAISSLRLFADPIDYDLMLSAGDLSGAELDIWDMTL